MDRERPKLSIEGPYETWPVKAAPHCDSRILHMPEDCEFCAEAMVLQDERERLEVSNSGHANRKYPCPADEARGKAQYSAWRGNRPTSRAQIAEEAEAFKEALARAMGDDQDPGDQQ